MVSPSVRTCVEVDLRELQDSLTVVLPLKEVHQWLDERLGPISGEILRLVVDCTFVTVGPGTGVRNPWVTLERSLQSQGLDPVEAQTLMRAAYLRVMDVLMFFLPHFRGDQTRQDFEYSMRTHDVLVLCFHPPLPRQRTVNHVSS